MKENESDYTLTFRYLSKILDNDNDNSDFTKQFKNDNRIVGWITQWKERVKRQKKSLETINNCKGSCKRTDLLAVIDSTDLTNVILKDLENDDDRLETFSTITGSDISEIPDNASIDGLLLNDENKRVLNL